MSSLVGHTLTSLGVYATTQPPKKLALRDLLWLSWLIFMAIAPDLDYVFPSLLMRRASPGVLRVTHSFVGCLVFPLLTLFVLSRLKLARETRQLYAVQVVLAGLSHLAMDMLVGVSALPLLWPFTEQRFKLPFGVLPSAPSFRLDNVYMYRNLLMEVGVLVPLYAGIYLVRRANLGGWKRSIGIAVLWLCSLGFMGWASTLAR
jgi:inner membrane protein